VVGGVPVDRQTYVLATAIGPGWFRRGLMFEFGLADALVVSLWRAYGVFAWHAWT